MNNTSSPTGVIFNIQRYCIHDGPGIRTTVFIKGCPMRCIWCQNPESQRREVEIFFDKEKCTGCGQCVQICPVEAITISQGRSWTDRGACDSCGKCIEVCPNGARNLIGKSVSVEEVFQEVARDAVFYRRSGGGVTISGGEVATNPEFVIDLLKKCQWAGIHTAIDTCGDAKWEVLEKIISHSDLVLYDIKLINLEDHTRYTGVSNRQALSNARRLAKLYAEHPMIVRVPIIPGYTDSVENIEAIARFTAEELGTFIEVDLLNYNPLGVSKYRRLERDYELDGARPFSEEHMMKLKDIVESYGLKTELVG
jgi:pyruvate formate lyase activating enzyme